VNNNKAIDMLIQDSYTFTCTAIELHNFKIICSTDQHQSLPANPLPINGAIQVDTTVDLSWTYEETDSVNINTFDVYFGTTNPPPKVINNQIAKTYNPGELINNTVYYWRIISHDSQGTVTSGPIWSFTTEESRPIDINIRKATLTLRYPTQNLFNRTIIINSNN
jgi:hypothetical protein